MIENVLYPPIEALVDAHKILIAETGSPEGIRNIEGLAASIARAEQIRAYTGGQPTIFHLTASIAFGIVKMHHPFVDGNKRVAFISILMMLELNGYYFDASEHDAADTILAVAAGEMTENKFVEWIKNNSYEQ